MPTSNPQQLLQGLQLFQQAQQLHAAQQLPQAAEAFRRALLLMPDHSGLLLAYAQLAEQVKDWKAAEQLYRRIAALGDPFGIDGKLGLVLYQQEQYDEACACFARHVVKRPNDADALRIFSTCHFRMLRWDEALPLAQRSYALCKHPDTISIILSGLLELGPREEMDLRVEEALREFPHDWQVRKLAGEHLLKSGQYRRGFAFFRDMRRLHPTDQHHMDALPLPWWDGTHFDGTLLVGAEQGIGDEIMTASVFGDVVALGQPIQVACDKRLLPVFRRSFPSIAFIDREAGALKTTLRDHAPAGAPANGKEFQKLIGGDLFGLFRNTAEQFPARRAWLVADPEKVSAFREQYRTRWENLPRIGLSWKSTRILKTGASKNVYLSHFEPLLVRTDIACINLQYGDITADIAGIGTLADRLYIDPDVNTTRDIDTLFAQVAALDLVITTSNTTAHVAGSLGVPCWVLLPRQRPVLWYWGYAGDSSPWYPSIRLLRNPQEGEWRTFLTGVAAQLDAFPVARPIG